MQEGRAGGLPNVDVLAQGCRSLERLVTSLRPENLENDTGLKNTHCILTRFKNLHCFYLRNSLKLAVEYLPKGWMLKPLGIAEDLLRNKEGVNFN